jgi:hypothetical protein
MKLSACGIEKANAVDQEHCLFALLMATVPVSCADKYECGLKSEVQHLLV